VSGPAGGSTGEVAGRPARCCLDPESRAWLDALGGEGRAREEAAQRLHAFLFRAARFRLGRRPWGPHLRGEELDDVAVEAADDALVTILARLEGFRGGSRFTTWACKFALLEASEALRKRLWKRRELPLDEDWWRALALSAASPVEEFEQLELLHALRGVIETVLTERQRKVFVAVALNGVPVDAVAARHGSTCGAVYKTLHDARRKLRVQLELNGEGHHRTAGAEGVGEVNRRRPR
jgi:RNA polymerase sigma-70 factor (ECF subfamily)